MMEKKRPDGFHLLWVMKEVFIVAHREVGEKDSLHVLHREEGCGVHGDDEEAGLVAWSL